ncbi:MAG TPA: hypothetical protein VFD70_25820 [Anaerolineae bacterium]|nr:hypothetical protein [Anaerolineae bacterium]
MEVGGDPDRDLNRIGESGASVAHSPLTFARVGAALYTLPRYPDHGVQVGIVAILGPLTSSPVLIAIALADDSGRKEWAGGGECHAQELCASGFNL